MRLKLFAGIPAVIACIISLLVAPGTAFAWPWSGGAPAGGPFELTQDGGIQTASGTNLVVNGGFENGLTGWTIYLQSGSGGSWYSQTGTLPAAVPFPITLQPPPQGSYAAMAEQPMGPASSILYQDVTVPPEGAQLSFKLYINNFDGVQIPAPPSLDLGISPNQYARADVMNPAAAVDDCGAGVLQNVFLLDSGDPAEFGYLTYFADLTPFAGQTVRLRFAVVVNVGPIFMGIDDVRVVSSNDLPVAGPLGLALIGLLLAAGLFLALRRRQARTA